MSGSLLKNRVTSIESGNIIIIIIVVSLANVHTLLKITNK